MKQSHFPIATPQEPSEYYGQYYNFGRNVNDTPGLISLNSMDVNGKKIPIPSSPDAKFIVSQIENISAAISIGAPELAEYAPTSNHLVILSGLGYGNLKVGYSTDKGNTWTIVSTAIAQHDAAGGALTDGVHVYFWLVYTAEVRIYKFDTSAHTLTLLSTPTTSFYGGQSLVLKRGSNYYFMCRTSPTTFEFAKSTNLSSWTNSADATLLTAVAATVTDDETLAFIIDRSGILYTSPIGGASTMAGPWTTNLMPYSGFLTLAGIHGTNVLIWAANSISYDYGKTWVESIDQSIGDLYFQLWGRKQFGAYALSSRYLFQGSYFFRRTNNDIVSSTSSDVGIARPLYKWVSSLINVYSGALVLIDDTTLAYVASTNSGSAYCLRVTLQEGQSTPVIITSSSSPNVDHHRANINSDIGFFPHFVSKRKLDPTQVVGCVLKYKPDDTYKPCDGVSTYTYAHPELKAMWPKVTYNHFVLPLEGYTGGFVYNGGVSGGAYVNTNLVMTVMNGTGATIAYSTDSGSTWNLGSYFASGFGNNVGISWDGTVYFFTSWDGNTGAVYTLTSLTGSITTTSWSATESPFYIDSISGSNTIVLTTNGKAFQTTNHGSSWTQIGTFPGASPAINYVYKESSTYYICSGEGIYSTTNFTSYTLISNSTIAGYNSIVKNGSTWATYGSDPGAYLNPFGELSTNSFASWTRYNTIDTLQGRYNTNASFIIDYPVASINGYFIGGSGGISTDGTYYLPLPKVKSAAGYTRHSAFRTFDFGGTPVFYSPAESGRGAMPFTMTIDTSTMQMPTLMTSGYYAEHGLYMKIHA